MYGEQGHLRRRRRPIPTNAIKWIEQVNRGGLFQVNDQEFTLFRLIELKVRVDMPSILS